MWYMENRITELAMVEETCIELVDHCRTNIPAARRFMRLA
jgi:hypothetical protein